MTIHEMLTETFYKKSTDDFSAIVEDMKRKAAKGLIHESPEDIENEVNAIFAMDEMYQRLDEEADEAIEKFSYLEE